MLTLVDCKLRSIEKKTEPKMLRIPSEYLAKMGRYSIKIEGVEVEVKVVDVRSISIVTTHIIEMRSSLMKSSASSPRVVGVDIKQLTRGFAYVPEPSLLVLSAGANCLIVHLGPEFNTPSDVKAPEELINFLTDTSVCFVGSTRRPPLLMYTSFWGVQAEDLAATVLKKPSLLRSTLAELAQEAGVHYEGPSKGIGESLKVDSINPIVLTEDQVKLAVSDAYAYYKIGHKLLSSL